MRSLLSLTILLAPPASAEEVAAVLLLQGDVQVQQGGTSSAAVVGMGLDRNDTLVTGEEGAAILHLHNNHLVRIDEDLELRVSDLVLLDAPSIQLDTDAQLATLLYPDERETMQGMAEAERVAGWHSRLSAGESLGAMDKADFAETTVDEDAEEEERFQREIARAKQRKESDDTAGGGSGSLSRGGPPPPPVAAPAPPPPPDPEPVQMEAAKVAEAELVDEMQYDFDDDVADSGRDIVESYDEPAPMALEESVAISMSRGRPSREKPEQKTKKRKKGISLGASKDAVATESASFAAPDPLYALRSELQGSSPLNTCLVDWAAALPVDPGEIRLTLSLDDDGTVDRVVLSGGLAAPLCARDSLLGRIPDAPESDLVFDLNLR